MAFVHHNLFTLNYPSFLFPSPDYQYIHDHQDLQDYQNHQNLQNTQNYYQSNVNCPSTLSFRKSLGDPFHNLSDTSLGKSLDKPFAQPSLLSLDISSTTYPNSHLDIHSHLDNNHSFSDFFSDFNIDFNTDFINGFNSDLTNGLTNGLTGDFIDDSSSDFIDDSNGRFDGDSTSEPNDMVIDDSTNIPLSPAFLKFLLDFRPFFLTSFRLVEFNRQAESFLLQQQKQQQQKQHHDQQHKPKQQHHNNKQQHHDTKYHHPDIKLSHLNDLLQQRDQQHDKQLSHLNDLLQQHDQQHDKQPDNNLSKTPRSYYQIKVSFPTKIPTQLAFSVIKPYLQENFPNARVLAVVHQNTPHTHCHIHLQAIEIDPNSGKPNGKKLHFGSAKFQSLDLAWARSYAAKFGNHLLEKHLEKKLIHKIDRQHRLELKLNQQQQQHSINSTYPELPTNLQPSINLQSKQIKDKAYFIEQEIRRLGLHYVYDSQKLAHHLSSQTSSPLSNPRAIASTERTRTLSEPAITPTERTIASATQPATSAERPTDPSPRTSFSSNSQQSYQQQQFNQQFHQQQQLSQQQSQQQPTITTSTSATEPSIADYQQRINDQQRTISRSEPSITNLQQSIARPEQRIAQSQRAIAHSQHLIDFTSTQADQLSNLLTHLGQRPNSRPRDSFSHSERVGSDGNDRNDGRSSNRQLNHSSDRSYDKNNDSSRQQTRDDDFFPSR
ncbi:MAG: hypothetical protein WAQ98_07555 [Blastocatellia bacterium]